MHMCFMDMDPGHGTRCFISGAASQESHSRQSSVQTCSFMFSLYETAVPEKHVFAAVFAEMVMESEITKPHD